MKDHKAIVAVVVVVVVVVTVVLVALVAPAAPAAPEATARTTAAATPPPRPVVPLHDDESGIFVSVASYRDVLCSATLASMFAMARNPKRVFAGVYEQNDASAKAESCLGLPGPDGLPGPSAPSYAENVRVVTVPAERATGPCAARYQCSLLLRDEAVFLQIDSHTEFARDWDVRAVRMLRDLPGALQGKVVVSTYPVNCDAGWETGGIPVIDKSKYGGGWITFEATIRAVDGPDSRSVVPSRQIGGGFLLCVADVVRAVPFDPGLDGVFNGEELAYTARLFTHGIDVVAPRRNLVCHKYYYDEHRVPWTDRPDWNKGTGGNERVDSLLLGNNEDQFGAYGMGRVRSLQDFWKHVQLDYEKKTVGAWSY
jgi:hypothetical protein